MTAYKKSRPASWHGRKTSTASPGHRREGPTDNGYGSLVILLYCLQRTRPGYELFPISSAERRQAEHTGTPQKNTAHWTDDVPATCLVPRNCPGASEEQRHTAGAGRVVLWRRVRSLFNTVRKRLHIPSGWVLNLTLPAQAAGTGTSHWRPLTAQWVFTLCT